MSYHDSASAATTAAKKARIMVLFGNLSRWLHISIIPSRCQKASATTFSMFNQTTYTKDHPKTCLGSLPCKPPRPRNWWTHADHMAMVQSYRPQTDGLQYAQQDKCTHVKLAPHVYHAWDSGLPNLYFVAKNDQVIPLHPLKSVKSFLLAIITCCFHQKKLAQLFFKNPLKKQHFFPYNN